MAIVAVSMSESDLNELEKMQSHGGFSSRSEVVRHALQSLIAEQRTLELASGAITAVFTVVYSEKGKNDQCDQIQHDYSQMITAMMHAHATDGGCVEVMLVKGRANDVRAFLKRLRAQNHVTRVQANLVGA
jgi:CopG family transcriptional regulator, nickel-responsive regulator